MPKPSTAALLAALILGGLTAGLVLGWSLTRPAANPTPNTTTAVATDSTAAPVVTSAPSRPVKPPSSPNSSPTPMVEVSVQPGSSPAPPQLQQAATDWVTASLTIDTARPYPGIDIATLQRLATGPAARDLTTRRAEWASPRASDQQGWKLLTDQHYRTAIDIGQILIDGTTATVIYTLTEYRDGHGTITARNQAMQLQMATVGGRWKVTHIVTAPQSP